MHKFEIEHTVNVALDRITRREKRLIAAMCHGVYIDHRDGHRWIECDRDKEYNLHEMLRREGVMLNNKIYGGVDEALDVIDQALTSADFLSLEHDFDASFDAGDVECRSLYADSRVDTVLKGTGGVF